MVNVRKRQKLEKPRKSYGGLSRKEKNHIMEFGTASDALIKDEDSHGPPQHILDESDLEDDVELPTQNNSSLSEDEEEDEEESPYHQLCQMLRKDNDNFNQKHVARPLEHKSRLSDVDDDSSDENGGSSEAESDDLGSSSHGDNEDIDSESEETLIELECVGEASVVEASAVEGLYQNHFNTMDEKRSSVFDAAILAINDAKWSTLVFSDEVLSKVTVQRLDATKCNHIKTKLLSPFTEDLTELSLKQRLLQPWLSTSPSAPSTSSLASLQQKLLWLLSNYVDLVYADATLKTCQSLMQLFAVHSLNHIYKFALSCSNVHCTMSIARAQDMILRNNEKIKKIQAVEGVESREFADQGFTRPKVLVVLPHRHQALLFANHLFRLTPDSQHHNKSRFYTEYGSPEDNVNGEQTTITIDPTLPTDHQLTFAGNIDDCFRIGFKFSRKSVRIFSEFYSSDLIIASPLGLRTLIGSEGDKKRDFDFLSSIELVIVDQVDVLSMQNLDHLDHLMAHLNRIPKESHGCDFSRMKSWYLDGKANYLRQTIFCSSFLTPEINRMVSKHFRNVNGRVKIKSEVSNSSASISAIRLPLARHLFTRVCDSVPIQSIDESRFQYFVTSVMPMLKRSVLLQSKTCIFIPSYFDYLRLRRWFTDNEEKNEGFGSEDGVTFTSLCEYTSPPAISRARSEFFNGKHKILLVTERFHFFRRYHLRGIQNLIFYALPEHGHFYSEFCDFLNAVSNKTAKSTSSNQPSLSINTTITALYTKYDALKMERILGTQRAERMIRGDKTTFMFA